MKKILGAILITASISVIIYSFVQKRRNTNVTVIKGSDGPTSIFLAGKFK